MAATRRMSAGKVAISFAICWLAAWAGTTLLRQVLVPSVERECYDRVARLQEAVDAWDRAHPSEPLREELDVPKLVSEGLLAEWKDPGTDLHYYFVGETAHGWRVRCSRHEDNPLVLRLTGVTLLALVLWVGFVSARRVSFGSNP